MRITQCDDQFLLALNREEASRLMDACAMVVLASQTAPEARLPPDMAALLCELFQGLKARADQPQPRPRRLQGS
jgi:hypothetical protein